LPVVSRSSAKNIPLGDPVETAIERSGPVLTRRGVTRRHERGARDAMDVLRATDECALRGRRSRSVLIPRRWYQVLEKRASQGRRRQQSPVSGETTKETVKTNRAGSAGSFRLACGDYSCVLSMFAHKAAGALSVRHSLRPPIFEGAMLGKARAQAARSRLCDYKQQRWLIWSNK